MFFNVTCYVAFNFFNFFSQVKNVAGEKAIKFAQSFHFSFVTVSISLKGHNNKLVPGAAFEISVQN